MEVNKSPIHASAFAYEGMGCLITGDSNSGKSRMLTQAIFHGAQMIADDQVKLEVVDGVLLASPVENLRGVLELRGFGLIREEAVAERHPIHLTIRLDSASHVRLPEPCTQKHCGLDIPYERLQVQPTAERCAPCQGQHEKTHMDSMKGSTM